MQLGPARSAGAARTRLSLGCRRCTHAHARPVRWQACRTLNQFIWRQKVDGENRRVLATDDYRGGLPNRRLPLLRRNRPRAGIGVLTANRYELNPGASPAQPALRPTVQSHARAHQVEMATARSSVSRGPRPTAGAVEPFAALASPAMCRLASPVHSGCFADGPLRSRPFSGRNISAVRDKPSGPEVDHEHLALPPQHDMQLAQNGTVAPG